MLMLVFITLSTDVLNAAPVDFDAAKRLAARIYADERTDFYCDCPIRWNSGKAQIDLKACGYQVRKNGPRAQRVEWEHVVPAQQFGASRACWKQGGREHCGDTDRKFRQIEADLFNLRPALGEVNGDRAHFRFAELPNVRPQHGACPIRIDFSRQLAEPRAEVRGDIARIYFYMADRYQLTLSEAEQKLFLRWHSEDPVDQRELTLMQRTAQQMGHSNDFVTGEKRWYPGYLSAQPEPVDAEPAAALRPLNSALQNSNVTAVLGNKNSKKYHLPQCSGYSQIKHENQQPFATEAQAIAAGYKLAGNCKK
ncbi:endonuclease [Rheinheimera sp. F8]|uniref:endonuclease n=1 Tax=Rheinheimera sp. F8 TaxID=1763998 RepID=UPI000744ACFD|nr:endonuclease [Rheinheimera sp. F8]ALZ76818.1 hypothetical protein ATY27_14335 [Rheinheimera sp. F8]